ncbi:GIY-YIG nuclease family protein [Mesorhizobium sp. KR2-14]|uniref:GIY-YIG nuclease family protein n=1 Tax=Mesorhizobium sp. KR2-14 TaxID=3156610 RepID=UPI0032B4DE02
MDKTLIGTRIPVWGILRKDPGFVYVLEDNGRYKIGKTKSATDRLRAAKTWLPDLKLVGCKPFWNVSHIERDLHAGFARSWYAGEWFRFNEESDRELLLEGFITFSDTDYDRNSINFTYWMNGEGMAEPLIEQEGQRLTLPAFLKQEALNRKS